MLNLAQELGNVSIAYKMMGFFRDTFYRDQHAKEGILLIGAQLAALEKKKEGDIIHGEIETHHPGYLGCQGTFHVGTLKGVVRICQQTFVDTYSKWAAAKLYTTLDELQTDPDDWIRHYNHNRLINRTYLLERAFQLESGSRFWNDGEFAQAKPL